MELIYGIHAVDTLLRRNPRQVQRLWVQSSREDKRVAKMRSLAAHQGVVVERCAKAALDNKVSGRHQGVVAEVLVQQTGWDVKGLFEHIKNLDHPALILILDGVTDPRNLGACLRSADAAGVDAVIVPKDKSVDLTPVVRKVACGAAETVPLVRVTNLARTLEAIKERGVWLYGAAGEAENSIYDSDLTGPCALVMGAEGSGLRRLTRATCDYLVKLPMAGEVSSLNVSVATGVCLFEIVRQRRA